jgi:hypothetical protein
VLRFDKGPVLRLNWHIRSGQNAYSKKERTPQGRTLWIRTIASGSMQRGIAQWAAPLEEGAKAGTIDVALPSRASEGDEVLEISMICFIETEQEGRSNLLELWLRKENARGDFVAASKSASWFSSRPAGLDALRTNHPPLILKGRADHVTLSGVRPNCYRQSAQMTRERH